ncbi:MAG: hypothetical protein HY786_09935 [Deltaproteobacteria bacterium]|nr:hypothetical protein [Deltaproteobacteria bacterium]
MSALSMTIQLAAVDVGASVISRFKSHILSIGKDAEKVKKDFDRMMDSFSKGAKALIVSGEIARGLKPGVDAAAALHEAGMNTEIISAQRVHRFV